MSKWTRHRFTQPTEDYRPVAFPPPGPWWCTGYGPNGAIIVAYLPSNVRPTRGDLWPEAQDIDSDPSEGPQFSERFPRPEWWKDDDAKPGRQS